jgi:hypothetical protein
LPGPGLVLALEMPFFTHDITVLLVLLAVLLLLAAVAIVHFASRRASRALDDVDLDDGPLQSFHGGLRWALPAHLGATSTPPVLVSLELFEWGVRIDARWSFLRPFVPSWFVTYEEVSAAEHIRRSLKLSRRKSEGVRLRAPSAGAPMIFWSSSSTLLLDSLEAHGVVIVRRAVAPRLWTNR